MSADRVADLLAGSEAASRSRSASSSRSPTRCTSGACAAFLAQRFPGVPVSESHRVAPVWREYERGRRRSSTRTSLGRASARRRPRRGARRARLRWARFDHEVERRPHARRRRGRQAVQTVLSGLAGGIVAGRHFALAAGCAQRDHVRHGGHERRRRARARRRDPARARVRARVRAADRRTGDRPRHGRRRWRLDRLDRRRRAAPSRPAERRSRPGPACYGLGGTEATVTDANLVLGRLDPDPSSAGRSGSTQRGPARRSHGLGERLGLDAVAAAEAVIEIANENMASAIRRVAVERGVDPRDFELVAFGGAGPLHAAEIAASLGMAACSCRRTRDSPPRSARCSPTAGSTGAGRTTSAPTPSTSARSTARLDAMERDALAALAAGGLRRRADGRAVAEHALRRAELRARGSAADGPARRAPCSPAALAAFHERHERVRLQLPGRDDRADPRERDRARPGRTAGACPSSPQARCRAPRELRASALPAGRPRSSPPIYRRAELPARGRLRGRRSSRRSTRRRSSSRARSCTVLENGILQHRRRRHVTGASATDARASTASR